MSIFGMRGTGDQWLMPFGLQSMYQNQGPYGHDFGMMNQSMEQQAAYNQMLALQQQQSAMTTSAFELFRTPEAEPSVPRCRYCNGAYSKVSLEQAKCQNCGAPR